MEKKITIDFLPDGTIEMEGHNFQGIECDAAMKVFEDALGVESSRTNKPEYHAEHVQQTKQVQ